MKRLKIFDFADVFKFAEDNYGIGWNESNNVFFGNSLDYQRHTSVYPGDWGGYVSFEDDYIKDKASEYTKEEVAKMSDVDKSYVVLEAYLESLGITDDEVLIDCS